MVLDGFGIFWVVMEGFIMKYKGFLYKMLAHDLLRGPLAIRPVPTHTPPCPLYPSMAIFGPWVVWSLGSAVVSQS